MVVRFNVRFALPAVNARWGACVAGRVLGGLGRTAGPFRSCPPSASACGATGLLLYFAPGDRPSARVGTVVACRPIPGVARRDKASPGLRGPAMPARRRGLRSANGDWGQTGTGVRSCLLPGYRQKARPDPTRAAVARQRGRHRPATPACGPASGLEGPMQALFPSQPPLAFARRAGPWTGRPVGLLE